MKKKMLQKLCLEPHSLTVIFDFVGMFIFLPHTIKEKAWRMLNKLWGFMILIGILFAAATGKIGEIGTAALDSSKEAVTLCITMLGIMSMWTGLMNIAKRQELSMRLQKHFDRFLPFYFRCAKKSIRQMNIWPPI